MYFISHRKNKHRNTNRGHHAPMFPLKMLVLLQKSIFFGVKRFFLGNKKFFQKNSKMATLIELHNMFDVRSCLICVRYFVNKCKYVFSGSGVGDELLVRQVQFAITADAVNIYKSEVVWLSPLVIYLQSVKRWQL